MTLSSAPQERSQTGDPAPATLNEVTLVGRVAASAVSRELPSGDTVWTFRTIVDRPAMRPGGRVRGAGRQVDTLDCAVWGGRARRTVAGLRPGDLVEVRGAVRRRFFRGGASVQSRVEVEVAALRVIRRAATA